ncbi:MAG: carboxypeptidase-like regulatory domain-containing protein [Bryobacteraceae bacterium]
MAPGVARGRAMKGRLTTGLTNDLILETPLTRSPMRLTRIQLTVALFCFCASSAMAQFSSAIQGVVTDASGAVIPAAVVHVTNVDSGVAREARTSNEGLYRVINLGPGTYRVKVAVKGFGPAERPSVPLGISETLRADFVLKVGDVVEQVTVADQITRSTTNRSRHGGKHWRFSMKTGSGRVI